MDMITSLLRALGIDSTLWVELGCFLICYIALTKLVFQPYLNAFHEREKSTIGTEETAVRIVQEAQQLTGEYEKHARAMNADVKGIYDASRAEAMGEYDTLIKVARGDAARFLTESRGKIEQEIKSAKQSLAAEIPALGSAIATKLAGKDISV